MVIANILSHLIELTSNVTNAYTTILYSANQKEERFDLRDHFSLNSNMVPKKNIPFGQDSIRKAISLRKPLVIDHFDPEAEKLELFKKKEDLKSYLIVPVIHEALEGVMVTATKEAYSFSPKLQKIVSGFADQIAWHLFREKPLSGLSDPTYPSIKEMNTYLGYLADSPDKATIAKRLIDLPKSILNGDAMAVVWFQGSGTGKVIAHRGFEKNPTQYAVTYGSGIIGVCAQNRTPIVSKAFDNNLMTLFSNKEKPESFKSVAAVPVLKNNCMLGVLVCASLKSHGLSQPDLDTLSMVASAAATSLVLNESKGAPANDKNRDPITGLYNRRFLIHRQDAISEKIFAGNQPVYFLTAQLTNLPALYETHGIRVGDSLLRGLVSLFSQKVPSPKNIFKFTDHSFLIMILKRTPDEVDFLKTHLKDLFNNKPLSINGTSLRVKSEWGLSAYPDEGDNLLDLINLSWAQTSHQVKVTT